MQRGMNSLGRIGAFIVMGSASLLAQGTQTANLSGEVQDRTGAPIAGVTIRLTSPALQGTRTLVSDAKGHFATRLLPPGTYTIELTKDGMQALKATQALGIGTTFEPRYTMTAQGGATVEVVGSASEVDKTDIKSATNYRLDAVDRLPNGRTMEALALLTPGVTSGVGGRVQIRGAMTSGNLYLLDGQNISDNTYSDRGVRLIDDSLEEVQIITGALSAEYGSADGGVLNAITRSGGNEFQGQLRWELSNPAWNAYRPLQSRSALNNQLNEEKTLSLSGYFIKDRLWFSTSFFSTQQNGTGSIGFNIPVRTFGPYTTGNGAEGFNAPYDTYTKEVRRQFKLTYALNENHQLVASFNNARIDERNRNYSAGELRALVPQYSTSEFMNLQWRAIWTTNLTTELKVGQKKQKFGGGATNNGESPIFNYDVNAYYNQGIFNAADGGDNRNNRTLNFKATLFWDALGSHLTDMGVDYYKGTIRARNEQTSTGLIFGVKRMNLDQRRAYGSDVWTYISADGEANNYSDALYINDKWTLNKQLSLSMGLRFDHFKAENEKGAGTASSRGLSPRLGLKYDVKGDGAYVAGLSFARYNSKVLEGITNSVTNQGNPTEIDHPYIGPGGPQTFAFLTNPATVQALYDFNQISYYNNPALNVRLASNLKNPTVDELQASFMYSFNTPEIGSGFLRLTAVHKDWKNLFDYRVGNDGTVTSEDGSEVYLKVWENSKVATRKYKALELDGQLVRGKWLLAGNITWSELKGNYEGEGSSTPARGEGLQNFTVQDGVGMYDRNLVAPEGYLAGHNPLRMRWTASYVSENAYGQTTVGLVYRFDTGGRWSKVRNIDPADLNAGLSPQFGTSAIQYGSGRGMGGVYPSAAFLDLAVTHDFNLIKVGDRSVKGFVKLFISNVLNHQQQVGYNTQYADANGLGLAAPFTAAEPAKFGQPIGSGDYGRARAIAISTGFRF